MSSRPDCKICGERITMGGCDCGDPYFGFVRVVNGKRVPEMREVEHRSTKDGSGWYVVETGEKVAD